MHRALSLLLAAAPAFASLREAWWNVTYVDNVNPDGLFPRRVIGINGTWPPPVVDVDTSDVYVVHVTNSLDEPTTVHHHGMFFNTTPWFDGTNQITQCGIPPGQSFDYVIPVNVSDQWGTYWIHSHYSTQYVDGFRSPMSIHPPVEAYGYDADYTVVMSEWYHGQSAALLASFMNIADPGGAEPIPDSALLYFAANGSYLPPAPGSNPQSGTNVGFNENATLPFEPGKTYRLRLVNVGGFAGMYFWIDGHDMRVIEVDGTDTEEYTADMLYISIAQRYSVLVTARNDTSGNFVVHANMDTVMFDTVPDALNPNATALITYDASAPLTNGTVGDYSACPEDIDFTPLQPLAPGTATKELTLEFFMQTMTDGTNHATLNGTTFNFPSTPTVLSEMTLGENATVQNAYGPLAIVLDYMDVVDITLLNADTGKHPFHMHGHKFQIMHRATDYTSDDPSLNPPFNDSQTNPIRRDTAMIPGGGSITMRVVANNPGSWLFHCHIEWHMESGLAMTLVEAPTEFQERYANQLPQYIPDQCAALGLPMSGNAAGHASTTDLSGLTVGPFPQNNGWHSKGIGAMAGCVLTAVLGMATVVWYALGGAISEEEIEEEVREHQDAKAKRRRFFGLMKPKSS